MSAVLKQALSALRMQQEWHLSQVEEDEHGIIPADAYQESGLCDKTTDAIIALRDEIEKLAGEA